MWMERGRGGTCGKKKGSNMATSIISHRAGTVMSLYLLSTLWLDLDVTLGSKEHCFSIVWWLS